VNYPHVIACPNGANGKQAGTALAALQSPAATAMFADSAQYPECPFPLIYCAGDYGVGFHCWTSCSPPEANPVWNKNSIAFRHNGAANVGFADGHVKPIHEPGPFLDINHPDFYTIWGHPKPTS
jgi:prepilin-type processing-associated H-X9-DG protein